MNRTSKALLIVALELSLFAPTLLGRQKVEERAKTSDQYWLETGINNQDFGFLYSHLNCYANEKNFLACVNSVSVAAERLNLVLDFEGKIRPFREEEIESHLNEKTALKHWSQIGGDWQSSEIDFIKAWEEVVGQAQTKAEQSGLMAAALNGYLSVSQDPHTYLIPAKMYEEVISAKESKQLSAGVVVKRNPKNLIVRKVYEGSAAAIGGLRKGDKILKMNGLEVSRLLPSKVNDILRLRESHRLLLEIERDGVLRNIELLKTSSSYPTAVGRVLNARSNLGVVTIHKFAKDTCLAVEKEILAFRQQNIEGVILDLRDNPGGQVDEAACIIGLFVERGTKLFETRYFDKKRASDIYFAKKEPIYRGPLVTVINSGSASASEIVAGSLKDLGRARVVGERSFGKGSFQDGSYWNLNSKIVMFRTEGFYYFPSGWSAQLVGVQPDYPVNFNSVSNQREEDLFAFPLKAERTPELILHGVNEPTKCDSDLGEALIMAEAVNDDPQFQKAQAVIRCGAAND